jgi:hypothetical protein
MSVPSRDQVFISYSHRDKKWLDRLLVFLKPFQRQGLQVWADPYIQVGERELQLYQILISSGDC